MRMSQTRLAELLQILAIVILVGGVFAVDLSTESGTACPVAYVVVVLMTYGSSRRPLTWTVAIVCSLLTVVCFFLSPGSDWNKNIANRGLALAAIWVVAWFCSRLQGERFKERHLKQDLELLARQLREMAQLALGANSASSLDQIMQILTDQSRIIIGAHQAVTSFTADKNWSQAITGLSLSEKYAKYRTYDVKPDGSGIYAWMCEINRPVRMTQAELESHPRWRGFGAEAGNHPAMRGWLAAPLITRQGENLGLIQLSDKFEGEFTAEDEALLVQVAQMGSVAIEVRHFQDVLELRVAARTAELVQANQTLRAEIAERQRVEQELRQKSEELEEFNRLAVGREERMIELKRQINELARQAGKEVPYNLSFADTATSI